MEYQRIAPDPGQHPLQTRSTARENIFGVVGTEHWQESSAYMLSPFKAVRLVPSQTRTYAGLLNALPTYTLDIAAWVDDNTPYIYKEKFSKMFGSVRNL